MPLDKPLEEITEYEKFKGSIRSIDKLQVILKQAPLTVTNRGIYYEATLPSDYVEWSRISADAQRDDCCPPRKLKIFLGEEADVDLALLDKNKLRKT